MKPKTAALEFKKKFLQQMNQLHFTDYFNSLPDVYYFAKNTKGQFVGMNQALLKAIGLEEEHQVLGKTDHDFFNIRLADSYREEDKMVMKKGPLLNKIWHVPDGEGRLHWYISSKHPLYNRKQNVIGIIGLMRDARSAGQALGPYEDYTTVLKFIHDHYHQQIDIPSLASLLHISVSLFERRFRELFKMTPIQYINKVRLDIASELLVKTELTISTIAQKTGFYDHTYFAKRFKNEFSISPKFYRRKYQ